MIGWRKNWRAFVYALVVALGVVFLQQLALGASTAAVAVAVLILLLILLMQLFIIYAASTQLLRQLDLPSVEVYTKKTQFIYHLLIPLISLLAIIGFVLTNNQLALAWIYFLGTFALFTILFINIRAYYEDKFKLEQQTHVVYDILKIILFFTIANFIFNLASRYAFNFFVVAGLVFVAASVFTLLVLLRHPNLGYLNMGLVLCSGLVIGYLGAALRNLLVTQNLVAAFYATLVFYIANAILHHELERTLKFSIVLEYILVGCICFLIILLLS